MVGDTDLSKVSVSGIFRKFASRTCPLTNKGNFQALPHPGADPPDPDMETPRRRVAPWQGWRLWGL